MDVLMIAVAAVFFLLTWGLMRLCEKLMEKGPEGRS